MLMRFNRSCAAAPGRVRLRLRVLPLLMCAILLGGCGRSTTPPATPPTFDPSAFDQQRAYDELVRFLALGLRDSGTPGAERAASYLADRLKADGIETHVDEFDDPTPRGPVTFRNVIGRLPGQGAGLIIIGSHYDTKAGMPEGFEGANDSGSSTAVLLELARIMAKGPAVAPEIWFAFFDGEECMIRYSANDGLHGSRRMAGEIVKRNRASEVLAVIILDMIGDSDLTITIPRNTTSWLVTSAFDAARDENARALFSLYPFEILDDHVPFLQAGMPVLNLIDFHYGSEPGRNDHWHSAGDTLDKISAESLGLVGRVTIRVVNRIILRDR